MQLMSSLQLEAYNYIKNLIFTHQLDVNTLYSETKLSKELGISRTPMREALQCLSQDGYITVIPSKGFRIRQLSQKDVPLKDFVHNAWLKNIRLLKVRIQYRSLVKFSNIRKKHLLLMITTKALSITTMSFTCS